MVVSASSLKWSVVVIENEGTRYEHIYCAGLCATKRIAEELRADTDADYFCCNGLSCADTWNPETGFDWLCILVVPTILLGNYGISLEDIVPEFEFGVATKQGELIAATVGYEEEAILASRNEDWMPVVLGNTIRLVATRPRRNALPFNLATRIVRRRGGRRERREVCLIRHHG